MDFIEIDLLYFSVFPLTLQVGSRNKIIEKYQYRYPIPLSECFCVNPMISTYAKMALEFIKNTSV